MSCQGQGGTSFEQEDAIRIRSNHWQPVECAAESQFILNKCVPWENLEGYTSSGYKATKKGFKTEGALTHVFVQDDLAGQEGGPISLCPPIYTHDLSLWVLDEVHVILLLAV